MLNTSFYYRTNSLIADTFPVAQIAHEVGTPLYLYSLKRALHNYYTIKEAFDGANIQAHIHYSIKANGNLALLRGLIAAGAGMDAVSGGEIFRAITAGASPDTIVYAGVGKTTAELRYAVEQRIGWINVENRDECDLINAIAGTVGVRQRIALRLNPHIVANTIPNIATGHGGAKFGLSMNIIEDILRDKHLFPHLDFAGIHIHIGSQLHDIAETAEAVKIARDLAFRHGIKTLDIGGGFPVAYQDGDELPHPSAFAQVIAPLVNGLDVMLEPGRGIIADAGILVTEVQYIKKQDWDTFVIVDAGMTELIRPMLYEAHHSIIPLEQRSGDSERVQVVGPVCESTDVFARQVSLVNPQRGDLLAVMTAGAYGMAMASNYNARVRPAEVMISASGLAWEVARRRETWEDLIRGEA